jgi:chromate reductase
MDRKHKVAVIVGSLSKASITRKVAKALVAVAPPSLECAFVEIGALPLYTPDFEADPPPAVQAFRGHVRASDALLFATPEYNRSVPGCLKNAIDVGSRPYGKSVWGPKPGAVVSVSPGVIGGFGANQHLRQSFVFLDILAMQQPEAYIGGADKLFDADGKLNNEGTGKFLEKIMATFAAWIERTAKA